MNLSRLVHLYNDGEEFNSMWDSKPVTIPAGGYIEIVAGLADHFMSLSDQLRMEEKPEQALEPRTPVNPLDQEDRGEAFAAVKKTRKPKGE